MVAPVPWDYRARMDRSNGEQPEKIRSGVTVRCVGRDRGRDPWEAAGKKVALSTSAESPTTASDEMRAIGPGFKPWTVDSSAEDRAEVRRRTG